MQKHTRRKLQASLFIFEPKTWQHKALFWLHYHTFEYLCSTDVTLCAFRSVTLRVISDEVVIKLNTREVPQSPTYMCSDIILFDWMHSCEAAMKFKQNYTETYFGLKVFFGVLITSIHTHKVSADTTSVSADVVSHFWVQRLQNSKKLLRVKNTSDLLISNKISNVAVWLGITIKNNNKKQQLDEEGDLQQYN